MRSRCTGLRPRGLLGIVVSDFLFAPPTAPRVVTGVDQDAVSPSDETGLAAKAGDAALHFQEGLLHGVFGVAWVAKDISRQVLHARAMQGVETVVGAQIAGSARRSQCGILASGIPDGRTGAASKVLGRFHSRPPFARQGRDSSLPRQRQSHSSHAWLLGYRRPRRMKCQGCARDAGCNRNLLIVSSLGTPPGWAGRVRDVAMLRPRSKADLTLANPPRSPGEDVHQTNPRWHPVAH